MFSSQCDYSPSFCPKVCPLIDTSECPFYDIEDEELYQYSIWEVEDGLLSSS